MLFIKQTSSKHNIYYRYWSVWWIWASKLTKYWVFPNLNINAKMFPSVPMNRHIYLNVSLFHCKWAEAFCMPSESWIVSPICHQIAMNRWQQEHEGWALSCIHVHVMEELLGASVLILIYAEKQGSPQEQMSLLAHRSAPQGRYKFPS